ncbi:unnamed protein product [Medioppia subpectinata]|uniref:Uncharacterized protein n=1 Tax=Medioppia subpectinata TaxID=1979941 RepID=A0A7R9KZK4_9ACAR|nr:unnamed protein product [Medioppia subpectinata]CAG2112376.1 unnamed protein product [Medioppia subpectinata]
MLRQSVYELSAERMRSHSRHHIPCDNTFTAFTPLPTISFTVQCLFVRTDGRRRRQLVSSVAETILWRDVQKRDINFARLRTYWRIIRLKDRGVEHNMRTDRVDRRTDVLVYKAEVNRTTTLGGIIFPLVAIICCIGYKLMPKNTSLPPDPYYKPSFLARHVPELVVIVSLFHINLSRRYILRMYFNHTKSMFTVSTWRWYLPFKTHTFQCKPGSAAEYKLLGINSPLLGVFFGNCKIQNTRHFINENHFTFPAYYNVLYGFSPAEAVADLKIADGKQDTALMDTMLRNREKEMY